MTLKDKFHIFSWEMGGLILVFFCVLVNLFPAGHIILGGDILQPINMIDNFSFYYYEWSGRVSMFYGLFYFLDKFGISSTAQISWYLGIFLVGSYLSFLAFCKILFPLSSRVLQVVVSLFYATNLYTLYVFTATWGYTSYQILYVFIPVLVAFYFRALVSKDNLSLLLFLLLSFFSSMSFGNPAFALSLGIFFSLLTALLFMFGSISISKIVLKRIIIMGIGAFLLNVYWIIPMYPQVQSGIEEVYSSKDINLEESLQKTSNTIFDTLRLLQTNEQERYYPTNFPYPTISWLEQFVVALSLMPALIVFLGWLFKRNQRESRLYGVFFGILLLFTLLVARVHFPFDGVNRYIFTFPGLNVLRGYDKTATFIPFILSTLLFLALHSFVAKKYFRYIVGGFFLLTILLALPFYVGGIQTKMSYILYSQKQKDFREATYSAIVKIPQPYYDVIPLFDADQDLYKISMLPFSKGSSVGRVSLPDWKVNGPHVARSLYDRPYIELTEPYISGWNFAEDFEKISYNPQWITNFFGVIGVKYIFYHKDATSEAKKSFEKHQRYLENIGALEPILDTESFILYKIPQERLFPYVYKGAPGDNSILATPQGFLQKAPAIRSQIQEVSFNRENQKSFFIEADGFNKGSHIVLNERHDTLWRAEYISESGERHRLTRDKNVQYANSWNIPEDFSGGVIHVFSPILKLAYIGKCISGFVLLFVICSIYWLWRCKRQLTNKK